MKSSSAEFSGGRGTNKKLLLIPTSLFFLTIIPLLLIKKPRPPVLPSSDVNLRDFLGIEMAKKCDVYTGKWVPFPQGPAYYSSSSCKHIIDQQNCVKFGRPDAEFMKWRWRPDDCELPLFNASLFLELVRGKSMAFVGDSVGRNQMQSLLCLLSSVAEPEDISHMYTTETIYFRYWFYSEYKFTLATLWSPFLVKSKDADPNGHSLNSLMSLYLDEPDDSWANQVEKLDYVILSAGHWFFRPLIYYMNGQIIGCHACHTENISDVTKYYGYRMAFRTAFRTLQRLKGYRGITFLRTFSPSHFENGEWNTGGSCPRTRPFTSEEVKLEGYILEFYLTQVEELRKAEKEGRNRGLKFKLLATTEVMQLRPDGHPNYYGYSPIRNLTVDCVHWCLPGPIDTWNEFLLYMMIKDAQRSFF